NVIGPFPRREKIEVAEFLIEPDGLIEHALRFVVPAHFDKAREREILAQRMAVETVVREQSPQIRVTAEENAVKIVGLALEPERPGKNTGDRRHWRRFVGLHLQTDALVLFRRQEMIDDVEPF